MRNKKFIRTFLAPFLLVVILNLVVAFFHNSIDLTAEKRFTLSQGTENLLKKTKTPINIKVFLKGNYPGGFRKLGAASEDLLRKFREVAGPALQYELMSPEEIVPGTNTTYADTLETMGIVPLNLNVRVQQGQQQQFLYPVAMISGGEKTEVVELYKGKSPLISNQELFTAEALLEYTLASGISKVVQMNKPVIGYLIGNGEPMDERVYDLTEKALGKAYELRLINLTTQPFIHPSFDALLMVKPTLPFNDFQKLTLDQYVQHGGKIIFSIDRLEAEMDSLQLLNQVIAYDRQLGIADMLFRYGVRINPDLLMDLQCDYLPFDVNGNGQFELIPWNYFPVLESSENHPINKNLGFVSGRFVNTLDTIKTQDNIRKTILLSSSVNSRSIATPARISGEENITAPENERYNRQHIPVSVILEGTFSSFYAHRLSLEYKDSLIKMGMPFLSHGEKPGAVMVLSDGDVFLNDVTKEGALPMGMNRFTLGSPYAFPFANRDFLLNTLEYFVNRDNLMEAKSRNLIPRLLDTKRTEEDKAFISFINVLLPVLLTLLAAVILLNVRSRRYKIK